MTVSAPEVRLYDTAVELRDVDVAGRRPFTHLEGRAVPYNQWADVGWYLEQWHRDALERSTTAGTGKGLPLLLWHDHHNWPIGLSEGWKSKADGLHGVWRLNDSTEAQRAADLARSGEMGWLSIGFSPIRSDWALCDEFNPELGPEHMDRVTRMEARLLEVSLVSTPAFEEAEVTLVRTAAKRRQQAEPYPQLRAWQRELETLRR